jgi:hypothetical protein
MPYSPDDLTFQTFSVRLPTVAARHSFDITIIWPEPLPSAHYQVGLAAGETDGHFMVKAKTRAAVLISATAGAGPIRLGTPLTVAALHY